MRKQNEQKLSKPLNGWSQHEMSRKDQVSPDYVTLDPRVIKAGFDLTGYYVETGLRSFSDYAQKMIGEYGEEVRPYLMSWYLAVRYYPGVDTTGMDSAARVDEIMAFEVGYN